MAKPIELTMYIDYIEVGKSEKSMFKINEIDYLYDFTEKPIKQLLSSNTESVRLHYTKPVKELLIVFNNGNLENVDVHNFVAIENMEIRLNNIKLETSNDETYFRLLQPYFHNRMTAPNTNIYLYSFAFDPDNSQPTGSYNFGNLNSKELKIIGNDLKGKTVSVYANTNNVLKVDQGQSSIQFI